MIVSINDFYVMFVNAFRGVVDNFIDENNTKEFEYRRRYKYSHTHTHTHTHIHMYVYIYTYIHIYEIISA